MPDESKPKKPYRLNQNDRLFLRKLRIAPSEDPEPDYCQDCDGSGQTEDGLICPTCRGLGYVGA